MAATFVIEDGTGKSNANAYISEAAADQYHEDNGTKTAWDTASDKEQSIRNATKYLEVKYKGKFIGERANSDQALSWPRIGAEDSDGRVFTSTEMPTDLLDACAELALDDVQSSTDLLADQTAPVGLIKRQRNTVGPITQDTEYVGGAETQNERSVVLGKLRPLLIDTDVLERG